MSLNSMQDYEIFLRDKVATRTISFFLRRFGVPVTVFRIKTRAEHAVENIESSANLANAAIDVYGSFSGISPAKETPVDVVDVDNSENVEFEARVLFTNILTNPYDAAASGLLEQQVIYSFADIVESDKIKIEVGDEGSVKEFLVGQALSTGLTEEVYKSFEVNPVEA